MSIETANMKKDLKAANLKNLDVKIGTENEIFWVDVQRKCRDDIVNAKREITINEHIIELTKRLIITEQKDLNT